MNAAVIETREAHDLGWRRVLVAAGLLIACVLFVYRDTGLAMVAIWSRSDTFAHAYLVPPIVAWLVWRKRHALAAQVPRPTAWALLPVAVAGVAWLVGDLAASNAVAQLAFTALLVLVVVATIGPRASRTIAFPLAFLFFSVPVGEFVMPQMMQWTADFTVLALQLSGIPVYREGLQFVVPSGNWSVVEACSGIRYLIASIMVGTLFAYLNYHSLRRRLIFTGVSIVVPIVANWVRAYLIVMIGDLSGNAAAASADHLIYGWVFFGIVITLMFMIGARWSEPMVEGGPPLQRPTVVGRRPASGPMVFIAMMAALLILLPHLALRAMLAAERPGLPALVAPTSLANGWTLQPAGTPRWTPAFKGAAATINRSYARPGAEPIGVYIGYYRHQNYAAKLVSSENRTVTLRDRDWSAVREGHRTVSIDGVPKTFRAVTLRGAGHIAQTTSSRLQVLQIYWIDGTLTSDDTWAKVVIAYRKLIGRGDDAAVLMVYQSVPADESSNDAPLDAFVRSNLGVFAQVLDRARNTDTAAVLTSAISPAPKASAP